MASLRRLLSSAAAGRLLFVAPGQRTSALKVVAAGACAGAAFYYYYLHHRQRCWRSRVEARLSTLLLPSVCATDKARSYSLDDGDVYMSSYENRFRLFSSVEHEGQLFMTPLNFIESVTVNEPKSKRAWRSLTKKELDKMLADTPPVWKGSSNLFRNLRERGVISYTEYLFLLCILTKPHAGFRIAFNMFDADGNEMVDKREFLVLEEIFRKKKDRKEVGDVERLDQQGNEKTETTLLVHFFGKKGKAELKFEDFYKFMDNLQTEVLEIEFLSYSKGMPTISEEDFARILLRYTNVDDVNSYLESVRHSIPDEKGITFEEFRSFFQFLNNLEDFAIAMQMYNFAHRSIGQEEFARAVYVATGIKLTRHLVNTVFKIFDEDHDDKLSHKEFIGVMKERLHRGSRVRAAVVFKHPTVVQWFEHTLNSAATSCHHTHTHTRTEVKLLSTEIFLNKY
ncbi:calcium uptake protein 3, mitochondrial isoform X4 [Cynoglossus semilaevis]|uniref:calcium uptake protein 3, mitochondrial isoform X4 n=1 Tax=Cynoglossus semilaevis TaxID=244447 RepID=UPI000D62DB8E|nr:calcium uptake protein 3, mitochondrial-like isoform X4 [Cynoglossus semilaevis]